RAELLRLRQRTARKRGARNAGRKPEIVLDARTRACLAPGGEAVDHAYVQAFGGRVYRGCKARRTRTDDDDIVHARIIGLAIDAEAFGEAAIVGISEDLACAAHHHGEFFRPDVKALEERL